MKKLRSFSVCSKMMIFDQSVVACAGCFAVVWRGSSIRAVWLGRLLHESGFKLQTEVVERINCYSSKSWPPSASFTGQSAENCTAAISQTGICRILWLSSFCAVDIICHHFNCCNKNWPKYGLCKVFLLVLSSHLLHKISSDDSSCLQVVSLLVQPPTTHTCT